MYHVPHELPEAFPDKADVIQRLRAGDTHFAKLSDQYHATNLEIIRAESNVEPVSDFHLEDLKKRRLMLLDQIAGIINQA